MSSSIIIGFLDRARVRIQAEFTAPLADDERRELLIHAALLTGRAFAALPPERQRALAGVLREWIVVRFETCPLEIIAGDPMACPHRFASTFLAPAREYALATTGCNQDAGGIDYFLPMAAAAYLRHLAATDRDPDELLKPALGLCAAVAIHPATLDNHFQMATASIPKIEPVVDRTEPVDSIDDVPLAGQESRHRLLDTRRSLIVSACLAALMIVLGVQYLSTRSSKTPGDTAVVSRDAKSQVMPKKVMPQGLPPPKVPPNPHAAVTLTPEGHTPPRMSGPVLKSPSPRVHAYLRKVRDLAENSLAQVEVMLASADREGAMNGELVETLDYGTRRLYAWRQQFAALTPPATLTSQHQKVGRILVELGHIAQAIPSHHPNTGSSALRNSLSLMHEELALVLNNADAY